MIQQPGSVPEPQSCAQSERMMHPCNSTESLCRCKDAHVPRPYLFSPKQKETPGPVLSHTTNPPKAIVAARVQREPPRSALSKPVSEASERHSWKRTGKTSNGGLYKWREETLR